MALTYPVINKKTGEKKELSMSVKEYDEWRKNNPDWDKDWSAGVPTTLSKPVILDNIQFNEGGKTPFN